MPSSFQIREKGRHCGALALLILATSASADYREQLNYDYYHVPTKPEQSLFRAMQQASPIRQHSKTYFGSTRWTIDWRMTWQETTRGTCAITNVQVKLNATILMPRLVGASTAQQARFVRFESALKTHELGHYALGQESAKRIQQTIRNMPEMPDCSSLETAANGRGNRVIEQARAQEIAYDRETNHGITQGASIN